MTRVTTICCSALAFLALAKAPGPMSLVPLRPVWKLALNSHLSLPATYDRSRGFFAIQGDRLVAYDLASGRQLWLVESHPVHQPVADNDLLFVAEAGGIVALRAADGTPAWRVTMDEPLAVRPTAGGGWLIGATKAGALFAIREADGERAWHREVGSPLHAPPTIHGERLYAPMGDGRIVVHELDSGDPIWERRIGGVPNAILALDERVYAGSTDTFLYCLLARDGKIDWRWRTGGDVSAAPVADARAVYFVSLDNVIRSLSLTSGGQYWMKPLPFRPTSGLQLSGSTIVVAGISPTIKTFNAKDGAPGVDIAVGEDVAAPPQLLEDAGTHLPMLAVVSRHIVNGDSVSLSARSLDPAATPFAPLANPITPPPMQATRP